MLRLGVRACCRVALSMRFQALFSKFFISVPPLFRSARKRPTRLKESLLSLVLVGGGKGGSGNSRKRSIRDIDSVADTSLIGAVISRAIHDGLLR